MKKISLLLCLCLISLGSAYATSPKQAVDEVLAKLSKRYHITFYHQHIPKTTWRLGGVAPSHDDYPMLLRYVELFAHEFNKYPVDFIAKTKLKGVVFADGLSVMGQRRAAVPDYHEELLLYDFARGAHHKRYQRHVIHHEFYHMIEQEFFGNAYHKDPKWAACNPKGFRYGRGGAYMRDGGAYTYSHPLSGFVNRYATSGLEEDKAEVFATLFIAQEKKLMDKWIKNGDTHLKCKVDYMKNFLRSIDSKMDNQYWRMVAD